MTWCAKFAIHILPVFFPYICCKWFLHNIPCWMGLWMHLHYMCLWVKYTHSNGSKTIDIYYNILKCMWLCVVLYCSSFHISISYLKDLHSTALSIWLCRYILIQRTNCRTKHVQLLLSNNKKRGLTERTRRRALDHNQLWNTIARNMYALFMTI